MNRDVRSVYAGLRELWLSTYVRGFLPRTMACKTPCSSAAAPWRGNMEGSCQPQTASTRAQVDVYRRLSHGVAPPPSVWDQAVGSASTTPVCTSSALLSQVATWDAALLARMRARQRELAMPPPNLPTPVLQAVAIERQLPGLLQLQRRVWSDLVAHTDGTDLCSEATDGRVFDSDVA